MSRGSALARLAAAYARHQAARTFRRPGGQAALLLETYSSDRLRPLTPDEREALPVLSGCINCGICALVASRAGAVRLPDLASGYLRNYPLLEASASDLAGDRPSPEAMAAASAACPVGVPLEGVAAMVLRLSAAL